MAASTFQTTQYPSSHFVESSGTVLFHVSTRQICLLHLLSKNEYLLPKGRRNLHETRSAAAVRETKEETGLTCSLPKVKIWTRCPPADEAGDIPDVARLEVVDQEAFMVTQRELSNGKGVKFIWWFIGVVDEEVERGEGEREFEVEMFGFEEAVERVTYETDREVVREAIGVFERNFSVEKGDGEVRVEIG
jgi:8-oxo-dGTP pyrophosphatase MutT (NUDIX family)